MPDSVLGISLVLLSNEGSGIIIPGDKHGISYRAQYGDY